MRQRRLQEQQQNQPPDHSRGNIVNFNTPYDSADVLLEYPVYLEDATFSWGPLAPPTVFDIDLAITKGTLVAVVGPVGSGKSSLVAAMLGDMDKRSGRVNTQGTIGYVPQQAWMQNATLRDNILFGKKFNDQSYQKVVDACALRPDLEIFPGGDQTEIGEKGINLSGGQKQRVSLARAVYADAETYFLDDPLSAVDSHVGKHLFEKVIGSSGLLSDKTRIFVTNAITYLPKVDTIVVLSDGRISEMGSYEELLVKKGAFAEFLMTYLKEQEIQELSDEDLTDLEEIAQDLLSHIGTPEIERQLTRRFSSKGAEGAISSDGASSGGKGRKLSRGVSSDHRQKRHSADVSRQKRDSVAVCADIASKNKLIQAEGLETGKVAWLVYVQYMRALGFWSVFLAATQYALSTVGTVGSNVWLAVWSNDQPSSDAQQNAALRDLRLGVYGGLGLGQAIMVLGASYALAIGSINASRILHSSMVENILRCPMVFFDTTPLGRIVNRFSKDIDVVDTTIPMLMRPLIGTFLQVLATLIVVSMSTPVFLAVVLPIGIVYFIVQRFYISTSRQLKRIESTTRSPIFSHFSETLSGASTIRAYGRVDDFIQESEARVDLNQMCYYPSIIANRWLSVRLELVANVMVFCATIFAVLSKGVIDPGTVGLSISYASSVTMALTFMVRMTSELETNIVAVERIKEYATEPTEAAWTIAETKPSPAWPSSGTIQFQNYTMRYRADLDPVLRGITCGIREGEKIGIVGRTGAGKSSLTLALFRIIEPAGGTIFIDDIDVTKIGLHDLRSKLTIIPQDPVLFSGPLRMNLDPFGSYTDEEVWKAIDHSHLKTFVTSLPGGLHYPVAEGGENLSVGQRQLVCLARALLRKTKVLILDEATAAIDLETDDLIQATIRKEFSDCTVLTIAHRLNTIMDSTRILVLGDGVIMELDSPNVLLQDKKSHFYSMAKDARLVAA